MDSPELAKLINYIEENLRTSHSAGLTFLDPRSLKTRLKSKQNHVIFGRRGAGKSTFVSSLTSRSADHLSIVLNLEDYKDISFPNIILHVLKASFSQLRALSSARSPWYRFNLKAIRFRKHLRIKENEIDRWLHEPDREDRQIKTKTVQESGGFAQVGGDNFKATGSSKKGREEEISRSVAVDKLSRLQIDLPAYKDLFERASRICNGSPIFLILDDFYFIPKSIQPEFIDFFHRLTKGTQLFLKLATIKHRSRMYKTTVESYVGVEQGHDVYEIDLDYTLDKFDDLQSFMRELLSGAIKDSNAKTSVDDLFSGDGFAQLCLASGGVPRDFLSLFVRLANSVLLHRNEKITKVDVNEEAITNISSKMDSLKIDSAEERQILESYLSAIRRFVYGQKRTNAFLVAKPELEEFPQERQAIRELVDLRLIHLVDTNTSSAPSDGRRYEAYILDVGLYENSRPRNFTQVEPGAQDSRSRKDDLRASPRLVLTELRQLVKESGIQQELFVTD